MPDPTCCSGCGAIKPLRDTYWRYIGLDGDPWLYCPRCRETIRRERELMRRPITVYPEREGVP
jgi:hypothetical protein